MELNKIINFQLATYPIKAVSMCILSGAQVIFQNFFY